MRKVTQNTAKAIKEVYAKKSSYIISLAVASVIYSFTVLMRNYKIVLAERSWKVAGALILGSPWAFGVRATIEFAITAFLAGIAISMTVYVIKRQLAARTVGSVSGIILSVIAPACPACALGAVGLTGISGFIALLPFQGLELRFAGILLLVGMIGYLGKKVTTVTCSINSKNVKKA